MVCFSLGGFDFKLKQTPHFVGRTVTYIVEWRTCRFVTRTKRLIAISYAKNLQYGLIWYRAFEEYFVGYGVMENAVI